MLFVFCKSTNAFPETDANHSKCLANIDSIDGKQALRNHKSELEEFYNLSCDAVANLLVTITLVISLITHCVISDPSDSPGDSHCISSTQ